MESSSAIANLHTSRKVIMESPSLPMYACREEVEAGETQLFLEGGRPLREVAVLNVFLKNSRGQTLYEAEQVRGVATAIAHSGGCTPRGTTRVAA